MRPSIHLKGWRWSDERGRLRAVWLIGARLFTRHVPTQNIFGLTSHAVGGGDMEVTVTGFLVLDKVDLHDFNMTVKKCTGRMGVQERATPTCVWRATPTSIQM